MRDRVGIAWRAERAAALYPHLEQLDLVQLIAEDWFEAPAPALRALRAFGARVPLHLHATSLGLASAAPVDERRLARLARTVEAAAPQRWSEHLAFVRGGGRELDQLCAPPRTPAVLAGTLANTERAARVVGSHPELENTATLFEPPCSELGELEWTLRILAECRAGLLLDLHNLHANAANLGHDALAFLRALPLERVALVHIAGGQRVRGPAGAERILDDHRHPVPAPVFALLEELAALAPGDLDVVLEREGDFPPLPELLAQLALARAALLRGRRRRRGAFAS